MKILGQSPYSYSISSRNNSPKLYSKNREDSFVKRTPSFKATPSPEMMKKVFNSPNFHKILSMLSLGFLTELILNSKKNPEQAEIIPELKDMGVEYNLNTAIKMYEMMYGKEIQEQQEIQAQPELMTNIEDIPVAEEDKETVAQETRITDSAVVAVEPEVEKSPIIKPTVEKKIDTEPVKETPIVVKSEPVTNVIYSGELIIKENESELSNLSKLFSSTTIKPENKKAYIASMERMFDMYDRQTGLSGKTARTKFAIALNHYAEFGLKPILDIFADCENAEYDKDLAKDFVMSIADKSLNRAFILFYKDNSADIKLKAHQCLRLLLINPKYSDPHNEFGMFAGYQPLFGGYIQKYDTAGVDEKGNILLKLSANPVKPVYGQTRAIARTLYKTLNVYDDQKLHHSKLFSKESTAKMKKELEYYKNGPENNSYKYLPKYANDYDLGEIFMPVVFEPSVFDTKLFTLHSAFRFLDRYVLAEMYADKEGNDKIELTAKELETKCKDKIRVLKTAITETISNTSDPATIYTYVKEYDDSDADSKFVMKGKKYGARFVIEKDKLSAKTRSDFEKAFPNIDNINITLNEEGGIHTIFTKD